MEFFALAIAIILFVLFVAVGRYISTQKGRDPVEGVALGCLLGPIGWIIAALLPEKSPDVASAPTVRRVSSAGGSGEARASNPSAFIPSEVHYCKGNGQTQESATAEAQRRFPNGLAETGRVVVEAVWLDRAHPMLGIALGIAGVTYERRWSGDEDVKATVFQTGAHDAPTKVCPDCAEKVLAAARICRFCRYEFQAPGEQPPHN